MSTVLRSFPVQSRQGSIATTWSASIPGTIRFLQLQGSASDPVLSDEANVIEFVISVSPDGTDGNPLNKVIFREPWQGGIAHHHDGTTGPNIIDITFGPLDQYVGWHVKLAADINLASGLAMVIGGTVTSLP